MNERIRELAREAGLLVHNPTGVPTKLEKFAQLIVQECMEEVMTYQHHRNPTIPFIVEDIKKHFGVEE
jgi:hypothetical protein